jgi:hypothetical protein
VSDNSREFFFLLIDNASALWPHNNGRSALQTEYDTHPLKAAGAADKAAIQRVKVPSCQLPDSGM